jgi:hypothetical protein
MAETERLDGLAGQEGGGGRAFSEGRPWRRRVLGGEEESAREGEGNGGRDVQGRCTGIPYPLLSPATSSWRDKGGTARAGRGGDGT